MGVGLALLPQLIARSTRAQVDDRVSKLRGVCSTRIAAKLGTLHFVGESQVYLPLGWDAYRLELWGESYLLDLRPDEQAAFSQLLQPGTGEVQLAALQELVRAKRYDALPEQSERHEVGSLAPVEHVRGIISGYPNRFLFETDARSATRSGAYFMLWLVAFAFTSLLALRRHRQGVLELVARRQRLAALRQPTE